MKSGSLARPLCRFLFLALLAAVGSPARLFAHDPGLSSAHVSRTNAGLEVGLTFAWSDLAPLVHRPAGGERPAAEALAALGPEFARAADGFVQVASEGVSQTPATVVFGAGNASPNEVTVSLRWPRVSAGKLALEFPVLRKMPFGHRMILMAGDSSEAAALLEARHATWELAAASSSTAISPTVDAPPPARASGFSFVLLGVEHILTGFDHLCFLFALLLVAVRMREVLAVVTAFTIAHSLTLAAAATGLVSLSPRVVEPLIAASIVYIGVENLFLRRPPRHRIAVVFGFGLVHGLGFASALAERLPGVTGFAVVPPLLGFNVGVELGQLAVASCLVPLIHFARTRPRWAPRLQPVFSLAIAVAGAVWFCQRV
jgi:hydrogenase/urease accessory protein HupE